MAKMIGAASQVGTARRVNEDRFWYSENILVVADGMGGHAAGEVASDLAIRVAQQVDIPEVDASPQEAIEAVKTVIKKANSAVWQRSDQPGRLSGMGTTLIVAWLGMQEAVIGHVGDSRAYIIRNNQIERLTSDHSVAEELLKTGNLNASQVARHPYRHMLTRAIGATDTVQPDIVSTELLPNDLLLLCTDGLTGTLTEGDIISTVRAFPHPQNAADELVARAQSGGASDDITVLLARHIR